MIRRLRVLLAALLALSCFGGCYADFRDGDDFFYLNSKGVSMPVWVTGNWRSNRIIVHVHGGPGTTNGIYYQKSSYQRLARDFGVAYWEQRASGSAKGNHREDLTMEQWIEDLDDLVTLLRSRYPEAELVLMGHSFGGFYGARWLLEPGRQGKVKAWIEQDGAHDASCRSWQLDVDFVLSKDVEGAAEFFRDVYRCDLVTNENNMIADHDGKQVHLWFSEYVRAAGGYDVNPDGVLSGSETSELLFRSMFDIYAVTRNSPLPLEGYYGVDLTPRLGEIRLPTLVLWGAQDHITSHQNAQPAFDAYGAPPDQKRLVLFERSGHNPWAEQPDDFYEAVSGFLRDTVWPR